MFKSYCRFKNTNIYADICIFCKNKGKIILNAYIDICIFLDSHVFENSSSEFKKINFYSFTVCTLLIIFFVTPFVDFGNTIFEF